MRVCTGFIRFWIGTSGTNELLSYLKEEISWLAERLVASQALYCLGVTVSSNYETLFRCVWHHRWLLTVPAFLYDIYYCTSHRTLIGFVFCKYHAVSNYSDAKETNPMDISKNGFPFATGCYILLYVKKNKALVASYGCHFVTITSICVNKVVR